MKTRFRLVENTFKVYLSVLFTSALVIIIGSFFFTIDINTKVRGTVEPEIWKDITVPEKGIFSASYVKEHQWVTRGVALFTITKTNLCNCSETRSEKPVSYTIKAPFSGSVKSSAFKELRNKQVFQGQILLKLVNTANLVIKAEVLEKDRHKIKTGMDAKVKLMALPSGKYPLIGGKVIAVGDKIIERSTNDSQEQTGIEGRLNTKNYFPVYLGLAKPYQVKIEGAVFDIKPGYTAIVQITTHKMKLVDYMFDAVMSML